MDTEQNQQKAQQTPQPKAQPRPQHKEQEKPHQKAQEKPKEKPKEKSKENIQEPKVVAGVQTKPEMKVEPLKPPLCKRHGRPCTSICKYDKCGSVFICQERECIVQHIHSKETLNVYFIERMIKETEDIQKYVVSDVEQKIHNYYEKACEEFHQAINQFKEMALINLDKYKHQITLLPEDGELLSKMKGNSLFTCPKDHILKGWKLLSNASIEMTRDKEIGYFIRDLEKGIRNFETNFQKCLKHNMRKMFDFQGSILKDLGDLEMTKDEYDILVDLFSEKEMSIQKAKVVFNAKQNSFSGTKFHQVCNSLDNTITIVRSTNKRLFGGYACNRWNSNGNYETDTKAFLFSVDCKTRCNLFSNQGYALYHNSDYGPTWGGNHDLYLANNCGSNSDSYSQLGYSFKPEDPSVDQSYALAGQRNFQVQNYLVLQIQP